MRSRVFIASASSPERMAITHAVAHRLETDYRVQPIEWTYAFPPGENTLNSLLNQTREVDFALFILGPDDELRKPMTYRAEGMKESESVFVPRDNVIFEMGLFISALGKERCFVLMPTRTKELHMLTDYLGENHLAYDSAREPGVNDVDLVRRACYQIGLRIQSLGPRNANIFRTFFGFKNQSQAVVVYPHILCSTVKTRIHWALNHHDYKDYHWPQDPHEWSEEFAHFDDLRAVSAITEMCGGRQVNVIATRDGNEQDVLQSIALVSFTIGLRNGYTEQAFEIIASETGDGIALTEQVDIAGKSKAYGTAFVFNKETYPKPHSKGPSSRNYAIIVRTFLRGGNEISAPRFVCGGCGAPGTAATGVYLKNHWKDLLSYFELCEKDLNRDSLAVLLRFWGKKMESAKTQVEQLCFYNRSECVFFRINESGLPEKLPEPRDEVRSASERNGREPAKPRKAPNAPAATVADGDTPIAPPDQPRPGRRSPRH